VRGATRDARRTSPKPFESCAQEQSAAWLRAERSADLQKKAADAGAPAACAIKKELSPSRGEECLWTDESDARCPDRSRFGWDDPTSRPESASRPAN
jgi:hypothetical protein